MAEVISPHQGWLHAMFIAPEAEYRREMQVAARNISLTSSLAVSGDEALYLAVPVRPSLIVLSPLAAVELLQWLPLFRALESMVYTPVYVLTDLRCNLAQNCRPVPYNCLTGYDSSNIAVAEVFRLCKLDEVVLRKIMERTRQAFGQQQVKVAPELVSFGPFAYDINTDKAYLDGVVNTDIKLLVKKLYKALIDAQGKSQSLDELYPKVYKGEHFSDPSKGDPWERLESRIKDLRRIIEPNGKPYSRLIYSERRCWLEL
jgi:hypothetical protein